MIHTSNRRWLQFAGLALAALWYLGKDNVTPEAVARIEAATGPEQFVKLSFADMPAWMAAALDTSPPDAAHG